MDTYVKKANQLRVPHINQKVNSTLYIYPPVLTNQQCPGTATSSVLSKMNMVFIIVFDRFHLCVCLCVGSQARHHVRVMHRVQPEEGLEGRAHQPSQDGLRQGVAAGAGD